MTENMQNPIKLDLKSLDYCESELAQKIKELEQVKETLQEKNEKLSKIETHFESLEFELRRSYEAYEQIESEKKQLEDQQKKLQKENKQIKDVNQLCLKEIQDMETKIKEDPLYNGTEIKKVSLDYERLRLEHISLEEKMRELMKEFTSNGQGKVETTDFNMLKSKIREMREANETLELDNENCKEEILKLIRKDSGQLNTAKLSEVHPHELLVENKNECDEQPFGDGNSQNGGLIKNINSDSRFNLVEIPLSELIWISFLKFIIIIFNIFGLKRLQLALKKWCTANTTKNLAGLEDSQRKDVNGVVMRSANFAGLFGFLYQEIAFPVLYTSPDSFSGIFGKSFAMVKCVIWLFTTILMKIFKHFFSYIATNLTLLFFMRMGFDPSYLFGDGFSVYNKLEYILQSLLEQSLRSAGYQPRPFPLPG